MSLRANLAVIVCGLALAGCGGDDEPVARSVPAPTVAATATATITPTATATSTPEATATAVPPEGGDEQGNRTDVAVVLAVEDVIPARPTVPAFLGLRLKVTNESGAERILRLDGRTILEILPGEAAEVDVEGLQPGEHILDAGESGRAVIVAERAR